MGGLCFGLPFVLASWLVWRGAPQVRRAMTIVYGSGAIVAVGLVLFAGFHLILDERVVRAAERGDPKALRSALDAGGNVRNLDPEEGPWPGVEAAVRSGNAECVELLLKRGAPPVASDWNASILEIARSMRRPDLVRLLRRYGAV